MRICVYGAGAIGGWLAVRLALAGHEVSVIARGAHLAAIRERGLTLVVGEERFTAKVRAAEDAAALRPQDAVVVTLKASGLDGLAAGIRPLLGAETALVFTQNGIPWWYAHGLPPGAPEPPDLAFLDAEPSLRPLAPRVLGAVLKSMVEVIEPGVVLNRTPAIDSIVIGEPSDEQTARVQALRSAFAAAGVPSPLTDAIRTVIWNKLLMNTTGSVMCMLTGLTNREMHWDPRFFHVLETLRREVQAIGAAHGCPIASLPPVEKRVLSDHKPSILQDYERGRAVELDAIVAAPLAFARAGGLATPTLDLMASLAVQKAMAAGLYQPRGPLPF
jgi:2-dehydropantoate 2-reductase